LLGTAVQYIGERPALQSQLRANPELIGRFVEETLRVEGPVKGQFRFAQKTTTLGGVKIPAGTTVFISLGAANRDPRQFDAPAELRAERANARRHIAFGYGIHTCPGAPLARAEVRICLQRLLERTSDIWISENKHGPASARHYDYLPAVKFRGLQRLHVEYTLKT
jgi:cytochrome P450